MSAETGAPSILCVDDEEHILTALQRTFRPQGYRLRVANGGAQAIEMMQAEPADLVICDMRMPAMNGAEVLAQVAARWPRTVRVLLTGYSDLAMTVDAVNRGRIYQYVSKPWEDSALRLVVANGLEQQALTEERERLRALTAAQNAELQALNAGLEAKVAQRTAEISQALQCLDAAKQQLEGSFETTLRMLAHVVELAEGTNGGHAQRVADLGRATAERLGLPAETVREIYYAGLLHDIGKIGMPERIITTPWTKLTPRDRDFLAEHTLRGEGLLMALPMLETAARYVRGHHERYDGRGSPDGLRGEAIPLGARILAAANDYDALQGRSRFDRPYDVAAVRKFLADGRGTAYDPAVVDALLASLDAGVEGVESATEREVTTGEMEVGMVLTRALTNKKGMLLLNKGSQLTPALIAKIRRLEELDGGGFRLRVQRAEGGTSAA